MVEHSRVAPILKSYPASPTHSTAAKSNSSAPAMTNQTDLSPAQILHLQATCGNHFVQRLIHQQKADKSSPVPIAQKTHHSVVQRVKTPKLDATINPHGETADTLAPVFRNTLILLKGQLKEFAADAAQTDQKQLLLTEVDNFFGRLQRNDPILVPDMDGLIDRVNLFTDSAVPQAQASTLRAMNPGESQDFDDVIDFAIIRATQASNNDAALDATFAVPISGWKLVQFGLNKWTVSVAKDNFVKIIAHLKYWKLNQASKVQINTAATGYNAYNQGVGTNSSLVINHTAFADHKKSANTLVHEASHGGAETKDLGYIGAPYFFTMPDKFRLKNADHYSFATQFAHGEVAAPNHAAAGAMSLIDTFGKAKNLAYYKADRTWTYLMWMVDTHGGKTYVPPETIAKHKKWIGLEDRPSQAIDKENARLLLSLYANMKSYLAKDMTYNAVPSDVNALEMAPTDNSRKIIVRNLNNQSVDAMSGLIFDALCEPYGIPQQWNIHKVGMKLFRRLFVKGKDLQGGNAPQPFEKELYAWFGGV